MLGVAVWAVVALLPLTVSDDIFGPALGAHWPIFPAAAPPTGPGADTRPSQYDQVVHVPPGSRLTISMDQVDQDLIMDDFQPVLTCYTRNSAAPWREQMAVPVPVAGPAGESAPDLRPVRLSEFRAVTGEVTIRCLGSEVVDLKREDPGVQRRLELTTGAFKYLWPALVAVMFGGPVLLFRRRRARRRSAPAR